MSAQSIYKSPAGERAVMAMIMGWHREAVSFVRRHQRALSQVPVAYFMTAMSLTKTP